MINTYTGNCKQNKQKKSAFAKIYRKICNFAQTRPQIHLAAWRPSSLKFPVPCSAILPSNMDWVLKHRLEDMLRVAPAVGAALPRYMYLSTLYYRSSLYRVATG